MYQCPETEEKLISARVGGGTLWYGRSSSGRMLTVSSAKHFIGEDGVREIWVRAQTTQQVSEHKRCPSCRRGMKLVFGPQWMGSQKAYVCTICHVLWLEADQHPEVPVPADLLYKHGDSTAFKDLAMAQLDLEISKHQREEEKTKIFGEGPDDLGGKVFGILGLPVDMGDRELSRVPWVTYLVGALCLGLLLLTCSQPAWVDSLGFYPDDPLRNVGLNVFTSALMHADWWHFLGNFYFFKMLGDDVEDFLGHLSYVWFLLVGAAACALGAAYFSGAPSIPHVGLSGVVTASICCHALLFPKNRVAFFYPILKWSHEGGGFQNWKIGRQWFRLSIHSTALLWVALDLLYYFLFEKNKLSGVAYSMHLAGAAYGFLAGGVYRIFRRP